jgi:hypothetical protein
VDLYQLERNNDYDMFGLLNKYYSFEQYGDDINCLDDNFDVTLSNEWRYSYNPFNERY